MMELYLNDANSTYLEFYRGDPTAMDPIVVIRYRVSSHLTHRLFSTLPEISTAQLSLHVVQAHAQKQLSIAMRLSILQLASKLSLRNNKNLSYRVLGALRPHRPLHSA